MDESALEALIERARRDVDSGLLPAAQWALAVDGEVVAGDTIGDVPAGAETRFVMFSCTKAIVASAVWQLLGEGSLKLAQRVAEVIPEFGSNGKDGITVEQVLLHTAGFPHAPLGPPAWASRDARLEAMANWRLNWEPGSRFEYHATSAHWVLAELLERVDGADYRAVVRRRVLDPLGLTRLELGTATPADVATVRTVGEPPTPEEFEAVLGVPGIDVGEVTDQALLLFAEPENLAVGVPGGGAVATAADMARFYQGLLRNPGDLWDPATLADATGHVRNTFPDILTGTPVNRALAVVVAGDDGLSHMRGFGHGATASAFGHDGAGGQIAFADPASGASFVWFTNGLDRHVLRQWRRTAGIATKGGATARSLARNVER